MKIGIIPNTEKENTVEAALLFIKKAVAKGFDCFVDREIFETFGDEIENEKIFLVEGNVIIEESELIVSFGGDGTMLNTAYLVRDTGTPIIGVNFGKLGFLAECNFSDVDKLINDLYEGRFVVEERIALEAVCKGEKTIQLFAVNDIVIDRGRWPKMMEMTLKVDDYYVSTFSADGLIIATPTGSTGYSLSTGGPIVSPKANAITLNPISPHTLTMRPLVLSSEQKITVSIENHPSSVQINCDGQRVYFVKPPVTIEIRKSDKSIKLAHTLSRNYFEILRRKFFWGLDIRNNKEKKK